MGEKETNPGEAKKAGQRIVEEPQLVSLLLKIFAEAKANVCDEIILQRGKENTVDWILQKGGQQKSGCAPGDWSAVAQVLLARTNYWPEARDHYFRSYIDRKPRVLMNVGGGESVVADLVVERKADSGSTKIIFDNVRWNEGDRVTQYFSFSEYHRALTDQIRSQKTGILLANREPQKLSIDGSAFFVALRPDVVSFLNIHSREDALAALELSQKQLVLVGFAGEDPVDLVFEFASLVGDPSKLQVFYQRLVASMVHRRMKRICGECAREVKVPSAMIAKLPEVVRPKDEISSLEYVGCEVCRSTGIGGLIGIESGILFDVKLKEHSLSGASPAQVTELAYRGGARSLLEDALEKHQKGLCTFSEVLRCVTKISPAFLSSIASRSGKEGFTPYEQELQSKLDSLAGDLFDSNQTEMAPSLQGVSLDLATKPIEQSKEPRKTCVLVVEDDRDQRDILDMVLSSAGFEVITAVDGQDALSVLERAECEAIVCDLMMPVMSGEELVRALRATEEYRHLPVLMFTAMDDDQRELDLLSAGADDYCRKTIKREILVQRVKRLVARTTNPLSHFL